MSAEDAVIRKPISRSAVRTLVEWLSLGAAIVGYLVVYLAIAYSSPVGFVAGCVLCLLVAGASIYLHYRFAPAAPVGEAGLRAGELDWPRVFATRVRALCRRVQSWMK